MKSIIVLFVGFFSFNVFADDHKAAPAAAAVVEVKAPKGAKVFFEEPKNGATVSQKFKVKFGVKNIKIRPALEDANDHASGHHHVIVDAGAVKAGETIPVDANHIHFGKGQTETELTLSPGPHTLTLQFADGAHRSYGPDVSETIKITVK